MPKSVQVVYVDSVQAALAARLKPAAFKMRGRTFNRLTPDRLVQVINLQMAPYDPPGTIPIPGFRPSLYGFFTINLGVYVPEVARHHGAGEAEGFVREYDCCVRARLGRLGSGAGDVWWRNEAVADTIPDIERRLKQDGLPFLARFESRDAILREWRSKTKNPGGGTPPRIALAIIYAERGQLADAKERLSAQALEAGNSRHAEYVRSLASKLGIPL